MNANAIPPFYRDALLWSILLLGLLTRLPELNAPLLDGDSHRQGATASIARNYYEGDFNPFNPRITGWGTLHEPGLWPNEFPLYPWVVAILYIPFGEQEWIGRALSIVFCLAGAVWLYLLVRRFEGATTARFAALWFLIAPQAIYFGRYFERHLICVTLTLAALVLFYRWVEKDCRVSMVLMWISVSATLLMMPPLIIFAVPFAALVWKDGHAGVVWDWRYWAGAIAAMIPVIVWYAWAKQQFASYSLNTFGRDTFRNWGDPAYYWLWWEHALFSKVWWGAWQYTLGPIGLTLAVLGLLAAWGRLSWFLPLWVGTILLYFMLDVHPIAIVPHYVYYLFLLPPMAWAAGRASAMSWDRFGDDTVIPRLPLRVAALALAVFATLYHWDKMFEAWYRQKDHWHRAIEKVIEVTPEEARLIVDVFDPSLIHYTRRMGLAKTPGDLTPQRMAEWTEQGATHLVIADISPFLNNDDLRFYLKDNATDVAIEPYVRIYSLVRSPGMVSDQEERADESVEQPQ